MATSSPAPLKRLSRPRKLPALRFTERDLAILRAVARFRFLSSDQIIRLVGGSPQGLLVRLKLLFYHALLDRPRHQHAQLALFFDAGNRPLVYGLARKGAQVLAESGIAVDAKLDWTTKNARATAAFLAHTLETAEAMIAFDAACRTTGAALLIDHHELLPFLPQETRRQRDPFRCRVDVRLPDEPRPVPLAVVPDRLFSLAYADGTRHNYALEVDRGTMDVRAKRLAGKSSFRRKLLGYFHAWRARQHTARWGFKRFRILTVTTSETRVASMLAAQGQVTNGAARGLFLYTTRERLAADGALAPIWMSADADGLSLLEGA
jgi:hypothetical protein